MELDIYQVDAFTSQPFKGNPAGVCITNEPLTESLMLSIATEMAVSETAFLSLEDMNLRWFTPEVEVALCGHGTLATAHVMAENGDLEEGDSVVFSTLSGPISAKVLHEEIELDFPTVNLQMGHPLDSKLLDALGLSSDKIVSSAHFDSKVLIEVSNEETALTLLPNYDAMKALEGRGVIVTAKSQDEHLDFISRYFAPWVGVNEDPVTGSAHCALSQFWSDKLNKSKLHAYQASSRGGYVDMELLPNQRVKLIGRATTVIKGVMRV